MKRLVSVTAAEVTPQTARFASKGRVALDAVTVLAGPPRLGKTQFMIGACARATRGKLDVRLPARPRMCRVSVAGLSLLSRPCA